jgi:peptide chain release factor 3
MTFEFQDCVFNLLDTPGHEDFSEDTYRTLTAADSAVMVLDAAKGIEPQTLKLFEVCRLRDIPIVTFINKMDREAQDPFALLDEIESKLALAPAPLYWPQGSGERFKGMLDLRPEEKGGDRFLVYRRHVGEEGHVAHDTEIVGANAMPSVLDEKEIAELKDQSDMARGACPTYERQAYREGHMTPVLFGSALRHFGVRQLLETLASEAPAPRPQKATVKGQPAVIDTSNKEVTGFVFKIQANMDPNHRDRIAFFRMVSGRFQRGMRLKTAVGKQIGITSPVMFMAQDREIADEAFGGDVIGIPNHGALRVGDALSESGTVQFAGIPNFAPEILRRVRAKDPMKAKHLRKALEGLAEEGVTQLFTPEIGSDMIVGAVGQLQIEVMAERIATENNLEVIFEQSPWAAARWIASDDRAKFEAFVSNNPSAIARDLDGAPVYLAKNAWDVGYVSEKNPAIRFTKTKERA